MEQKAVVATGAERKGGRIVDTCDVDALVMQAVCPAGQVGFNIPGTSIEKVIQCGIPYDTTTFQDTI